MPKVSIGLVDGCGQEDYEEHQNFMVRLRQLQSQGLECRDLVDALITDDWGAAKMGYDSRWRYRNHNFMLVPYRYDPL